MSQTGSRNQFRRRHEIIESRNFVCAHIKRNDPISRRFLQYLAMWTGRLVFLVRDAKTGTILAQPPTEEMWLVRHKAGLGRAAKNDWDVRSEVGPQFFEEMEHFRKWKFGFKDHYDVYIWDLKPGQKFLSLHGNITEVSRRTLLHERKNVMLTPPGTTQSPPSVDFSGNIRDRSTHLEDTYQRSADSSPA